jgi:hypothetical protein
MVVACCGDIKQGPAVDVYARCLLLPLLLLLLLLLLQVLRFLLVQYSASVRCTAGAPLSGRLLYSRARGVLHEPCNFTTYNPHAEWPCWLVAQCVGCTVGGVAGDQSNPLTRRRAYGSYLIAVGALPVVHHTWRDVCEDGTFF